MKFLLWNELYAAAFLTCVKKVGGIYLPPIKQLAVGDTYRCYCLVVSVMPFQGFVEVQ